MVFSEVAPPLVLVTVGTDHHPFDRLVDWVDRWLTGTTHAVRCVVQHGTSRTPSVAQGQPKFAYTDLQRLVAEAHVVVCHGGPGTIMDSRQVGLTPIVVPRRHDLGEHVDNHQVRFTRRIAESGLVRLAETELRFRELVESSLADPRPPIPSPRAVNAETVLRFAEEVAELGRRRVRRFTRR